MNFCICLLVSSLETLSSYYIVFHFISISLLFSIILYLISIYQNANQAYYVAGKLKKCMNIVTSYLLFYNEWENCSIVLVRGKEIMAHIQSKIGKNVHYYVYNSLERAFNCSSEEECHKKIRFGPSVYNKYLR